MSRRILFLTVLGLLAGFGSAHADITTGLVGRYPLDGNAIDISGYANNGAFVGAVAAAADRFGNPSGACEFNGLNTYILIPNSASLSSPTTACASSTGRPKDGNVRWDRTSA